MERLSGSDVDLASYEVEGVCSWVQSVAPRRPGVQLPVIADQFRKLPPAGTPTFTSGSKPPSDRRVTGRNR